ncbi:hypothetical protein GQR58_030054 [Nymphon striatum]|nr:hypothetical protein GQR58_030054 [Nymphon striatum]
MRANPAIDTKEQLESEVKQNALFDKKLAQEEFGSTSAAKKKPSKTTLAPKQKTKVVKLSYKDQRELDQLPKNKSEFSTNSAVPPSLAVDVEENGYSAGWSLLSLEERITALSSELQSERVEHELTRGQFKESQASAELVKSEIRQQQVKLDQLEPTQQALSTLRTDYFAVQEQLLERKKELEQECEEHQLIEKEQQRIEIEQQRIERENVELNDKSVALQEQILTLDATLKAKNREHEKAKKVIEEQIKDKDNKLGLEQEQHEKAQQQQLDIKATMESVNAEKEKLEARLVNLENQTQETTQLRSDNTQLQQRIATLKTRVKIEQKEHEGTKASVEDALLKAKLANEEKEQLMLQMGSLDYNDENIEGVRSDNANLQKLVLQQSVELEAERDELEEAKALAVDAIAIKARQAQKESDELAQSEKSQRIRVQEQYSKLALLLHNVKSASAIKVDSEFSKEVSELQINGDGQVIKNEAVGNIP